MATVILLGEEQRLPVVAALDHTRPQAPNVVTPKPPHAYIASAAPAIGNTIRQRVPSLPLSNHAAEIIAGAYIMPLTAPSLPRYTRQIPPIAVLLNMNGDNGASYAGDPRGVV